MDSKISIVTWRGQWLGYLGLALLVAFMFLPMSYYAMVTFPWIIIWQTGFLLLGITLLVMLRQFDQPFRPLGYGLDWGIGAVAIACILSAAFAPFKGVALWNLATISGYGVVFYLIRNWSGQGIWSWLNLWRGLAIVSFGMSISSLLEWYLISHGSERNNLPLGHHNFVSAYLCLILPLLLSYALAQTGKTRILLLILTGLLPYNIYTCSSRGGFLGLLVWAIATVGFVIWRTKGKKRLIFSAIALGLLTVMIAVGLQHPRVKQIIQVNDSKHIPSVQFKVDGETEDRLFMWQAALNILKDRPLTGVGLGNTSRMYNLYRPINVGTGAAHVQELHSTPVTLFGELGLIGIAAIAFLFVQVMRLGWRIHTQTEDPHIKRLVYGVGGGYFAYGMATLTDYQLDNIPISLTLVMFMVLLLTVADQVMPESQPQTLPTSQRRILSLGSLGATLTALTIAMPVTYGMNLFAKGQRHWVKGYPEQAYEDITNAYAINRWNPNYPLRLGLWLLETRDYGKQSPKKYQELTKLAAQYFLEALAMAPNDAYFNLNVGILLSEIDSIQAQSYLKRAIELIPRDSEPVYFLLGNSYFKQNQKDQAIAAFALQGLISPGMMAVGQWDQKPLSEIRVESVERCLKLYQQLLDSLDVKDPNRLGIEEQMAWIAWWHHLPIPYEDQLATFSPMVQALILGDRQPEKALAIVNEQLATSKEQETSWLILRAWFDPKFPFKLQLKVDETSKSKALLLTSALGSDVTLQDWLKQIPPQVQHRGDRFASSLVYRNQDFESVDEVLHAPTLQSFQLFALLGLGTGYPRSFPPLEQLINRVRTDELGLLHPTENHFRLTE